MSAITDDQKQEWKELRAQADDVIAKLNALYEATDRPYRVRLTHTPRLVPALAPLDDDDGPIDDGSMPDFHSHEPEREEQGL